MNPFRENLVKRAFRTLDINEDGAISMDEIMNKYNFENHPEVRNGKKTPEQVATEFMQTFEVHHAMVYGDEEASGDKLVTLDEFIEYYNNISCSIDNDAYFDLMITNAWQLEGTGNPAAMPYAGVSKKIAHVNSRDAYRQDHHRNLFDTDKNTVWKKAKKVGDSW